MISIDGRKVLGLGFGGEGNIMGESELEEGEACSFSKNNYDDDDASVDPDIALSYIDKKLEHVLGHFQKDFEGGVSAENLGAKFGGYGSFLPTYQRSSPISSHPKTPQKVQNGNLSRSPNNLQLEDGHGDSRVSSMASQLVRAGPASSSVKSQPALKEPSTDGSVKKDTRAPLNYRANESINKKACNLSDQKNLKFRIKVGSDNLSTQKNAAIYSGLGLDFSPSSSLEGSSSESDGIAHDRHDGPFESPFNIIQIITSFPLQRSLLLSPLPDFLIHFNEKEKVSNGSVSLPALRDGLDSYCNLLDGSDFLKGDEQRTGGYRTKSVEKNDFSVESKSGTNKLPQFSYGVTPKYVDVDALVSSTLKLPLLSNSYSPTGDSAKGNGKTYNGEAYDSLVTDKVIGDVSKEEPLKQIAPASFIESSKVGLGKAKEDKKASAVVDISGKSKKHGHRKEEKAHDSIKAVSYVSNGHKALDTDAMHTPKQMINQNGYSLGQDGSKLPPAKKHSSSGGKRKSKGSHNNDSTALDISKETRRAGSSSVPKNKKSVDLDNQLKKHQDELKFEKDFAKFEDKYTEFFGDIEESEKEEILLSPMSVDAENRLKDSEVFGKEASAVSNTLKEKPRSEKINKLPPLVAYPKVVSNVIRPGQETILDTIPAAATSEDNWVCCDKCQTWRLLPVGLNPEDLPEKWLCSMLYWLPGMNQCSFSQDETTEALYASGQAVVQEAQNTLNGGSGGIKSGVPLANFHHPNRNSHSLSLPSMPGGEKKKHGSKEISSATHKDGPVKFSNSVKSVQSSSWGGNFNDLSCSPRVGNPSNSGDFLMERHKHKQEEKKVTHNSDGVDVKSSKVKSKRDREEDSFKASKKIKTEDWASDQYGAKEKVVPSSSSGFPSTSAGKDRSKYNDHSSSKDSKNDATDKTRISSKKLRDRAQVSLDEGSLSRGGSENRNVAKKRKLKESQDPQNYLGSLSGTDHPSHDNQVCMKEEFRDSVSGKEKKARVSKSEGKESSASKGNGRSEKKGSHLKDGQQGQDLGNTLSQQRLDGLDSLKNGLSSAQPLVATTSSSSKVSGSLKSKALFHESKGSPVESVSSSPMRVANPDKLASTRRNVTEKDDSRDVGFFAVGNPRRFSDGEDDGGSGRATKENTSSKVHHGSHESSGPDFLDKDSAHFYGIKNKAQVVPIPDNNDHQVTNGSENYLRKDSQHPSKLPTSDICDEEERKNDSIRQDSHPTKLGKNNSVRSKDKNRNFKSESDLGMIKNTNSGDKLQIRGPSEARARDGKNKALEKFEGKSNEIDSKFTDKKDSAGKISSESSQRRAQSNFGCPDVSSLKTESSFGHELMSTTKKKQQECNGERSSKKSLPEKTDLMGTISGRENSVPLPPSRLQSETLARFPPAASGPHKANGLGILANNACESNEASKMTKQNKKVDDQNGTQHTSARHTTPRTHRIRDADVQSPARRDPANQAANSVMKEATDLKHRADRFKNSGLIQESTGIYFQAVLKFLHAASLFESTGSETAKQTYRSTAKLGEFCARDYEKSKDMASASLAYKCMEVAFMRVIYNSHSSASRDQQELQTGLQMVPSGESPSSSASDVDNLNRPTAVDKTPLHKGVSSPQVAGHHVIAARNRPNLVRLLTYSEDVHFAMEASKKSRSAFATSNLNSGEDKRVEDGICPIKVALDFNFHDVLGFLRLVRLAMEAINC